MAAPARRSPSSASLVVWDALRLGSAGVFAGQGQHHQGDDVGQHVVHIAGQIQAVEQVEAGVHIAQGANGSLKTVWRALASWPAPALVIFRREAAIPDKKETIINILRRMFGLSLDRWWRLR